MRERCRGTLHSQYVSLRRVNTTATVLTSDILNPHVSHQTEILFRLSCMDFVM